MYALSVTPIGSGPLLMKRLAEAAPQLVEGVGDLTGAAAVGVDRPAFTERLVDDDALRDRWLPDRAAPDDPAELVDPAVGLGGHRRHPVDDDATQVEVGVVPVPHAVHRVG